MIDAATGAALLDVGQLTLNSGVFQGVPLALQGERSSEEHRGVQKSEEWNFRKARLQIVDEMFVRSFPASWLPDKQVELFPVQR